MAVSTIQFGESGETKDAVDKPSVYKRNVAVRDVDTESCYSEKGTGVRESDFKRRQVFHGWTLLWLAYQSTGVIYGDIGTSPLYVYSSTFSAPPSRANLLGALSLIIWSLTLIVTTKYILIVLRADDEGEGGTFAIYTLLSRYCHLIKRDPRADNLVRMERVATNDLGSSTRGFRNWLEKSTTAHVLLKILAVFGVSLIVADGILTPAQSVLGAIQGLEVIKPNISSGTIIGATCGILVALFLVQPLGIHRISSVFAPVVIIWLLFNASFGIYNLVVHDWTVLKAFSPYYAGLWFVRNKTEGWYSLGGILLAFTGVETLFADLGAFSRRAIQLSWLCLAYPCLLLAYIGQAAYISSIPSGYANPFFESVPPGMFYPSLVIAILAAIVASQATITSTFQLLSQVMHSSYFPHITLRYTSDKFHGQVYIPVANWALMLGTVVVTCAYSNTTRLGNAYGTCVILVTFITTNLVALVALLVWRLHPILVFVIWLPFVTLDSLFLSSSLTKVPHGAWFTLMLAVILASFFTLWRYGKEKQWTSEARSTSQLSNLIVKSAEADSQLVLGDSYGSAELTETDGMGIFFDKSGEGVPMVYEQWLKKFRAQMDIVVFMHMRALHVPYVSDEDRFAVSRTSVRNVYRLTIRHGYNDRVITPDLARLVYVQVRASILSGLAMPLPSDMDMERPFEAESADKRPVTTTSETVAARLQHLDAAYEAQALYLVGKEKMRINQSHNILKRGVLGFFLWVRENCSSRIEKLNVPAEKVVEVGFVNEI